VSVALFIQHAKHMRPIILPNVLETCRNKLIVKQKFCTSSWLITEINILRCTVSKTINILRCTVSKTSEFIQVSLGNNFVTCPWNWCTLIVSQYLKKKTANVNGILVVKTTRCTNFSCIFGIKLYMFRTVPLSIIRSFSLYTQQWYVSYSMRAAGSGRNCSSVLILLLYIIFTKIKSKFHNAPFLFAVKICNIFRPDLLTIFMRSHTAVSNMVTAVVVFALL
jgi:hypothetical protein